MHARRDPWFWPVLGIFGLHELIGKREIKIPKSVNDIPSRTSEFIRIRIIFTKHFNNKSLIGGMTARINR
jgi:hypothetical protein